MSTLPDVELLARLVAFESTSESTNAPIAEFIAGYLEQNGVRVESFAYAGRTRVNLVAWAGPPVEDSRRGLVLSGHMDVVPALEAGWLTPPFELACRDGRITGRGTADMKGFLAIAMNAASRARRLAHPLVLVLTADEEVGCLGARELVDIWTADRPLPRSAIIGEPTSLRLVRMHKGHLRLRISVFGVAAHSGYPHLGDNAIEKAGAVIQRLAQLRSELQDDPSCRDEAFEDVPWVVVNIATIHGGTAINIVPDGCEIELGVRLLPGMTPHAIESRIRAFLNEVLDESDWLLERISECPPMVVASDSTICSGMRGLTGGAANGAVGFATDAGWLQSLGLECVLCGPGSIEVAHRANEFVSQAELTRGRAIVEDSISRFCGGVFE